MENTTTWTMVYTEMDKDVLVGYILERPSIGSFGSTLEELATRIKDGIIIMDAFEKDMSLVEMKGDYIRVRPREEGYKNLFSNFRFWKESFFAEYNSQTSKQITISKS